MARLSAIPQELLEAILIELPHKNLLAARRICRAVRDTIDDVASLRRKLFVADVAPGITSTTPTANPFLRSVEFRCSPGSQIYHACVSFDNGTGELEVILFYALAWGGSSEVQPLQAPDLRMRMLLCQPSMPATVKLGATKAGRVEAGASIKDVIEVMRQDEADKEETSVRREKRALRRGRR